MPFVIRARDTAADLAAASKRQVQRARLEIESRRLESKINSAMAAMGSELYALIETGELRVDAPSVHERIATIANLRSEFSETRAAIETLVRREGRAKRVRNSIGNIDHNAMDSAAATQSARDTAARRADHVPEEGGEG